MSNRAPQNRANSTTNLFSKPIAVKTYLDLWARTLKDEMITTNYQKLVNADSSGDDNMIPYTEPSCRRTLAGHPQHFESDNAVRAGFPSDLLVNTDAYVRRACYNYTKCYDAFILYVTTSLPITEEEAVDVRTAIIRTLVLYGEKFTWDQIYGLMEVYDSTIGDAL